MALVPVVVTFIWAGQARACFWVLIVAFATDLLDGFLARRLGQVTALGARLDSAADLPLFVAAALGAWRLNPVAVARYLSLLALVLVVGGMAQVVSLRKHGRLAGFHTSIAKSTGILAAVTLLALIWGWDVAPLNYAALGMGVLAQTEQLAIAWTLRRWQSDLRSWWHIRPDHR